MRRRARTIAGIVAALLAAVAAAQAAVRQSDPEPTVPETDTTATAEVPQAAPPALDAPVPLGPATLAAALRRTASALDAEIDRWRGAGQLAGDRAPQDVTLLATYESRLVGALAAHPALIRRVLAAVPRKVAARVAPEVRALRDLRRLSRLSHRKPGPRPAIELGPPEPATVLLRHYRDAQRRFGVGWHVLAAVNYIESRFGRLRNESVSGARGPMQFMPATWRAYGLGGDIRDPRDAVMGAANYLRASGAPRDYRVALHHYNPSSLYVHTVRMYANRIARDPRAFPALYAREVVRRP